MDSNFLSRIIKYSKKHIFNNPRYLFWYSYYYFLDLNIKINYYSKDDYIQLIKGGKSIIRLGDGDIFTILGGGQPYQEYNSVLAKKLSQLIKEYTPSSNYVISLNKVPLALSNSQLRKENLLSAWLPTKIYWKLFFNKNASYYDAAMFYYKNSLKDYFEEYLKTKKIIFVSKKENCDVIRNNSNIPFTFSCFIETVETQAFNDYEIIKNKILNEIVFEKKDNYVVMAAVGPASKVLAYDLSSIGIQVFDVGQGVTAAYTETDHSLSENIRVLK